MSDATQTAKELRDLDVKSWQCMNLDHANCDSKDDCWCACHASEEFKTWWTVKRANEAPNPDYQKTPEHMRQKARDLAWETWRASRIPAQPPQQIGIDWTNDEAVVKAAIPDAHWLGDGNGVYGRQKINGQYEALGCGNYELAWKLSRQHPLVRAYEFAHRPSAEPTAVEQAKHERWGVHYDSMPHTCISPQNCDCNCDGCVSARGGFYVTVTPGGTCSCDHVLCPHCAVRIATRVVRDHRIAREHLALTPLPESAEPTAMEQVKRVCPNANDTCPFPGHAGLGHIHGGIPWSQHNYLARNWDEALQTEWVQTKLRRLDPTPTPEPALLELDVTEIEKYEGTRKWDAWSGQREHSEKLCRERQLLAALSQIAALREQVEAFEQATRYDEDVEDQLFAALGVPLCEHHSKRCFAHAAAWLVREKERVEKERP